MKRILTLLLLSFLVYQVQSQVLFSQDFESGVLDPMIALDIDGKVVAPQVANFAGPTWTVVSTSASNNAIVSTSWFAPVGIADDWLISDSLHVTSPNTFLIWEAYTPDPSFRDGYQVKVSTTGKDIASFTNNLLTIGQELTTWTTRSLNLDAFVGQTIYFAFRNNSNDKYLLYMDNIRVEVLKNVNAIARQVIVEKYQPVNSVVPITVKVENHGALPITSIVFEYTVNGYTYTDTVTGINIAPLATIDITHELNYTVAEAGEVAVDIRLLTPNGTEDEAPEDNEGTQYVYGLEEQLPKKVFVEEATGTWCQWCPRGAVFMDLIVEQFGDLVMPVAVHNFDPMTVPEYDTPFSASVSGYPSGHVDRKIIDTDPSEFPTAIASIQNRRVPVAVETTTVWEESTRTVYVTGTAYSSISTEHNALRFGAVVTEDNVTGTDPGYDQVNIYAGGAQGPMGGYEKLPNPVPASQMVYDFVARALIGGFNGIEASIPDAVAANEEFSFEFSYQVPAEYDEEEMRVIVYVMDDETGEMLNGDMAGVTDQATSVPLMPLGSSVLYPNPATDMMNLAVNYQTTEPVTMAIYDVTGRMIRDLGKLDLSATSTLERIDVSDMQTGNYILELRYKNSVTALPFTRL